MLSLSLSFLCFNPTYLSVSVLLLFVCTVSHHQPTLIIIIVIRSRFAPLALSLSRWYTTSFYYYYTTTIMIIMMIAL